MKHKADEKCKYISWKYISRATILQLLCDYFVLTTPFAKHTWPASKANQYRIISNNGGRNWMAIETIIVSNKKMFKQNRAFFFLLWTIIVILGLWGFEMGLCFSPGCGWLLEVGTMNVCYVRNIKMCTIMFLSDFSIRYWKEKLLLCFRFERANLKIY